MWAKLAALKFTAISEKSAKKIFRVTFNPLTEYSVITLQICALVRACSFFLLFSCIHVRFFAINFISFKIQLSAVEYF